MKNSGPLTERHLFDSCLIYLIFWERFPSNSCVLSKYIHLPERNRNSELLRFKNKWPSFIFEAGSHCVDPHWPWIPSVDQAGFRLTDLPPECYDNSEHTTKLGSTFFFQCAKVKCISTYRQQIESENSFVLWVWWVYSSAFYQMSLWNKTKESLNATCELCPYLSLSAPPKGPFSRHLMWEPPSQHKQRPENGLPFSCIPRGRDRRMRLP